MLALHVGLHACTHMHVFWLLMPQGTPCRRFWKLSS